MIRFVATKISQYIFLSILVGSCLVFLNACATTSPSADLSQNPAAVDAKMLMLPSEHLTAFKALGSMAIVQNNILLRTRMGLATEFPYRLRLELFLPTENLYTIVSNEHHIYIQDYLTHAFYVAPATERTLSRAVGIPIVPSDLICLLFGKIPYRTVSNANFIDLSKQPNVPSNIKTGITVYDDSDMYYKAYLDEHLRPVQLRYYTKNKLVLSVTSSNWHLEKEMWMPEKIECTDPNNSFLEITIDTIWPNEKIEASQYILEEPISEKPEGTN